MSAGPGRRGAHPGLEEPLPVVAFEIESSWRTRKHLKGDLLNLQDAAVSLGVIVLAGADARDESLRRFATSLVDRPGSRVMVWTDSDVRALAVGKATATAIAEEATASAAAHSASATASASPSLTAPVVEHTGKYRPLWDWLRSQERRERLVRFREVERVLGFPLPDSCRSHVAHWHSYQGKRGSASHHRCWLARFTGGLVDRHSRARA